MRDEPKFLLVFTGIIVFNRQGLCFGPERGLTYLLEYRDSKFNSITCMDGGLSYAKTTI